jgi:YebC/PmpR family DNA-binding regulatory protein
MSGHSHWSSIKHKKGANDARRGRLWSKLARNVIVAAKSGGGDASANLALRYAIDKAKQANMPRDTIEKAIKKGTGEIAGVSYEPVLYEGYGAGGVAIMIDTLTDNRNRTGPEIRKIFEKHAGNMGTSGCVAWQFSKRGVFTIGSSDATEDQIMAIALSAGADDYERSGELWEITCEPEQFESVKSALEQAEIATQVAELSMVPSTTITLDAVTGRKVLNLMEAFEDHDDTQDVYANFDLPDDVMAELAQ